MAADRFEGYYAAERYLIAAAGRSRLSVNVTRVNDDGGHASALKLYDDAISLAISAEEAKAHG